jgi:DNA-binding NarL/FixJ family response regulator
MTRPAAPRPIRRLVEPRAEGEEQMNGLSFQTEPKTQKRPWTIREVAQLKSLANQGLSSSQIAKMLNRSPQSVKQKAFWLSISLASRAKA